MFSAYPFYNCHNGHHGHRGGGIYNNLIVNTPEIRYHCPYPYPIINETINTNQFHGQNK